MTKFFISDGMIVDELHHEVISFRQCKWLEKTFEHKKC